MFFSKSRNILQRQVARRAPQRCACPATRLHSRRRRHDRDRRLLDLKVSSPARRTYPFPPVDTTAHSGTPTSRTSRRPTPDQLARCAVGTRCPAAYAARHSRARSVVCRSGADLGKTRRSPGEDAAHVPASIWPGCTRLDITGTRKGHSADGHRISPHLISPHFNSPLLIVPRELTRRVVDAECLASVDPGLDRVASARLPRLGL